MKTVEEIRKENLLTLRKKVGGNAALSKLIDRSESQISQLIRGSIHTMTGRPRVIGSDIARLIEEKTEMPRGWMDVDHYDDQIYHDDELVHSKKILKEVVFLSRLKNEKKEFSPYLQNSINEISKFATVSGRKAAQDMKEIIRERSSILRILSSESILNIILGYLKKSGNPDMIALAEAIEAAHNSDVKKNSVTQEDMT